MENEFFSKPILNSPYEHPSRHWELDNKGQPSHQIIPERRRAEFITPIPKPKKHKGSGEQLQLFDFEEDDPISSAYQRYDPTPIINELRKNVDDWRKLPNPNDWAGNRGNCKTLTALASSSIQLRQAFFLSDRGCGNSYLAYRSCAQKR